MDVTIKAEPRSEVGSSRARRLRRKGLLPAVVYGADIEGAIPVSVYRRELVAALSHAGLNALITLEVDSHAHLTVARQLQRDPVRNELIHVDFLAVRRDQAIHADVALVFVGSAPAEREGLVVSHPLTHVTVTARPGDIPSEIEVDISSLEKDADTLRAGDVSLPPGVTLMNDPEEPVASVTVSAAAMAAHEEEVAAAGAAAEAAEFAAEAPEGAAPEEGAAATPAPPPEPTE